MNKSFYTRDGVIITPGMRVFLKGEVYPEPPTSQVVDSISEDGKKVLFRDVGPNDYQGARVDGVFATAEACIELVAKTRVKLDLDTDQAHLILFALAKQLKQVRSDLSIMRIAKERELTKTERMLLPALVAYHCKTREEVADDVNPWISLEMDYMDLVEILEEKADAATKEVDKMWEENKGL